MKQWFQQFGFKQRPYDRPNQKWVCGRECLGCPCPEGPDSRGECNATSECRPIRVGDRWACNRPRLGADIGPCETGPSPDGVCACPVPKCTPARSLRERRGLAVLMTIAIAAAALLMLLSSPTGSRFMTPGELTHAHSSAQSRCTDCHSAGEGMPIDWVHAVRYDAAAPDSGKCLTCHPLGDTPHNPHSLPTAELEKSLASVQEKMAGIVPAGSLGIRFSGAVPVPDGFRKNQIQCSACHREHQGKNHDLRQLSDTQCQVCHAFKFGNFGEEHPSFGAHPFFRPTRIVFDHQRHLRDHFQRSDTRALAPESCLGCHRLDDRGGKMIIKPFEQACAGCHAKEFPGFDRKAPAIPFLRVPLIDVETLEEEEIGIGEWPDDWDSLQTSLSPFTQLLLAHDEHHAHAVQTLGDKDLDMLDEDQFPAAQRIAWGLKEFLLDASEKGPGEIVHRIESALARKLTLGERTAIGEVMAPELFRKIAKDWFPNLTAEVKSHRAGKNPPSKFMESDAMEERLSVEPVFLGGGWFRSDPDLTVYYRPAHHADPFLKIWLELSSGGSTGASTNVPSRLNNSLMGSSEKVAPGRCMKCHSREDDAEKTIHWHGLRPNPIERTFNRFSHAAHYSLLDGQGCVTCHSLDSTASSNAYLAGYPYHHGGKKDSYAGNFRSIDKATCASCHTLARAGESCLTCHNYHVGHFERTASKSALFETMDPRLNRTEPGAAGKP